MLPHRNTERLSYSRRAAGTAMEYAMFYNGFCKGLAEGPLGRGVGGKVNLPPYIGSNTLDQGSADSSFSLFSLRTPPWVPNIVPKGSK